jgi:hypothetical protein
MPDPHGAGIVVVGSSLAGLRACETLRQEGYDGRLTLVGEEPETPYDRPPLSKKLLAGEWEPDRVALRPPDAIAELGLDLRLGEPAVGPPPPGGGGGAPPSSSRSVRRAQARAPAPPRARGRRPDGAPAA